MNEVKTVRLNSQLKKEYFMKITHMFLTPPKLKAIRAFFSVTIGAIQMRDFKLIQSSHNGTFKIASPDKMHTKNTDKFCSVVKILDPKINDLILELALAEYEIQKENANANCIE